MAQVIGTVAKLVGVAFARASDGSLREIRLGDDVFDGEILLTTEGSVVEVAIPDAPAILVGGGGELLINGELTLAMRDQAEDASVLDETVEAILAALEGEGDLLAGLEATAAGGAAGNAGNSFVRLGRIGYGLDDLAPLDRGTSDNRAFPENAVDQNLLQQLLNTTTVSLTATNVTEDEAGVTFTATLSNAGETDVTVVTNQGDIVIAAGDTSGTLFVPTVNSDVYVDATSITAQVTGVTGGNFEAVDFSTATATATIADTIDTTTVSLTATNVTEDEAGVTFTATLSNAGETDVTVVTNQGDIVILAGDTSGTLFVPTVNSDVYVDATSITAQVTGVTGGNFEAVDFSTATATATIADTIDTTTVSLTATNVTEDEAGVTFTATLSNAGETDVTVVTNQGNIVILAGDTSGTLFVPTVNSDVYVDATSITAQVTGVTGGNFEAVDFSTATATAQITDTIDTTTVSLTATNVTEDEAGVTFTATLSNAGETDVTVVTNQGNIVILAGDTSGTLFVPTVNSDVYVNATSITAQVTGVTGGNFEAVDFSTATATAQITDTIDTTTVSLTATNVTEDEAGVTFTATLSNAGETDVTVVTNQGNIVIAAGDTSGTLFVPTVNSDVYVDATSITAQVTGVTGGNFEAVDFSTATATAQITDTIDTTTVSLTATNVTEDEAGVTFTATLSNAGETAVTVVTNQGNIVIAAGDTSGTLFVPTVNSDVYVDATSITAQVTGVTGGNFEAVDFSTATATAQITDTIDTTTVSLTATNVTEDEAGVTFTATLSNAGETDVTVVTNQGNIVILAGDTSGTLFVPTVNSDVYVDATSITAQVTGVTGGNFEAVDFSTATATAQITDTIDTTTVSLTATNVTEDEAGVTFTATLSNAGETAVTVVTNQGNIVILAGDTSGTLFVPTVNSDVYVDATSITAQVTGVTGGNFEAVDFSTATATAQITDTIDTTTVSLTATNVTEDEAGVTFTATLSNAGETAVTVVTNQGNIVIAAGDTSGTLFVPTVNSDVYVDATSITAQVTGVTGGNFEAVDFSTATATAQITDTIDTTTVTLTIVDASGTVLTVVPEGTDFYVKASVDNTPDTTLTLDVKDGAGTVVGQISIVSGNTSGTVLIDNPNDTDNVLDAGSLTYSVAVNGSADGNYENLVTTDTATIAVTDTLEAQLSNDMQTFDAEVPAFASYGLAQVLVQGGSGDYSYAFADDAETSVPAGEFFINQTGEVEFRQDVAYVHDIGDDLAENAYSIDVVVTDSDGNTVTVTANVNIEDDAPTATADTDAVTEGASITDAPNVLTNDSAGADGYAASTVVGVGTSSGAAGNVGTTVTGSKGTLTLNADGGYSYVANPGSAPGTDTFYYTIADSDGDESEATLTITVDATDLGGTVSGDIATQDAGVLANTADSGTAQVTGSGGSGGYSYAFAAGATTSVAAGDFSIDADTGVVTFTQDAAYSHAADSNLADDVYSIDVVITDSDGNTVTKTVNVDITDDAPEFTDIADSDSDEVVGIVAPNVTTTYVQQFADWDFGADGASASNVTPILTGFNDDFVVVSASATQVVVNLLEGEDVVGVLTLNADAEDTLQVFERADIVVGVVTIDTGTVQAGAPAAPAIVIDDTASGVVVSVSAKNADGVDDNVNPSTQGWAVDDQQIDPGESIQFAFSGNDVQHFSFTTGGRTGGRNADGDITLTITVLYEDATTETRNVTVAPGDAISFSGTKAIASVNVLSSEPSGGDGFRLVDVTAGTDIFGDAPDLEFEFSLSISDNDGDTAAQTFSVKLEGASTGAFRVDGKDAIAPIAIDLDGDGVEYLGRDAGVVFTDQASGESVNTAWVAPEDGMLVIDANNSGTIDESREYVFTQWSDTAETDMEAVAEVFDTNQDGVLDAQDEQFEQFAVWQDANSDGVTDEGELTSLIDLGVESIALNYAEGSESGTAADGDVIIHGQTEVTFTDGSTGVAEDTSFAISAADVISDDGDLVLPATEDTAVEPGVADSASSNARSAEFDVVMIEADLMLNQSKNYGGDDGSSQ